MNAILPQLPTPHFDKLNALLRNPRLPETDRSRVEEAIKRYHEWISALERVKQGQGDAVAQLFVHDDLF